MPPGRCHVVPHDRAPQRPRPSGKTSSAVRQLVTGARRARMHRSLMPKVTAPASSAAGTSATPDAAPLVGLTTAEAERRLESLGPNDPFAVRGPSRLHEFAAPFADPLVITLILASGIAALVGEVASASIIVLMVLLSSALHITQTVRSNRAIDRLRGSVAPTASVLRDGRWTDLPRREVVSGDV